MNRRPPLRLQVWDDLGETQVIPAEQTDRVTGIRGLGAALFELHNAPRKDSCPACGLTEIEYEQTGFLGCPLCYSAFVEKEAELSPASAE